MNHGILVRMQKAMRRIIWISVLVVIGGVIAWQFFKPDDSSGVRTAQVQRGTVVQDVSFTGRIQPAKSSELGFSIGGQITNIAVAVGDVVQAGALLAQVDPRTAQLDSAKAAADLASTSKQAELSWQTAESTWENTKDVNELSIEKQKQAVRDAKQELDQAQKVWEATKDEYDEDSSTARSAYAAYLAKQSLYNGAQKTLSELKESTAKSNATARAAADLAREQYTATQQASSTNGGLSSLEALKARSSVLLSQHTIYAPYTGTITAITHETGEYAAPGTPSITIQTLQELEVVSDVTETDAVKLAKDMDTTIELDALPGQSWAAHIVSIAPAAKIIEGVPTYEVTLAIDTTNQELRAGLTADISVHARQQEGVLHIPRRAVVEKNNTSIVRIMGNDGFIAEQKVVTGLVGSEGTIEIVSGLSEGQTIVLSTQDE